MKHLHVNSIVFLVLSVFFLASCSEDEDSRVPAFMPVSADYFANCVDGKGWRYAESHEIRGNGTFVKNDYWADLVGGAPEQYSFDGDSITVYMYLDAYPISGYRKKKYTYDASSRQLIIDGSEEFTVVSVSDTELCLIRHQGTTGNGDRIYVYAIYRAMSQGELATVRRNYPYNLNRLNEEFPIIPEQENITAADFNSFAVGQRWKCLSAHEVKWTWRYDAEEFFDGNTALKPVDYEISVDSIYAYTAGDVPGDTVRTASPYVYRANGYFVDMGSDNVIHIISLRQDTMLTMLKRFDAACGADVYLYCIYRRE